MIIVSFYPTYFRRTEDLGNSLNSLESYLDINFHLYNG